MPSLDINRAIRIFKSEPATPETHASGDST
jgi:hypothetical protein